MEYKEYINESKTGVKHMKKYIIIVFIFLASIVNVQADPFNVTTVLSVPHLTPGDRNIGLEFTVQNNQDTSIGNVKAYLFLRYPFSASVSQNNLLGEIRAREDQEMNTR